LEIKAKARDELEETEPNAELELKFMDLKQKIGPTAMERKTIFNYR
jgi:hypothetical protein